jgi:osmotically-inducible protein OsmY
VSSEVTNCVARLTGSVATGAERVEAMQVARATRGVCSVSQDIVVR